MNNFEWLEGTGIGVTVCDENGVGLYLNAEAAQMFRKAGGKALVGKSLLDCHPEPARSKMTVLLREQRAHSYTMEMNGRKKFLHAAPWYREGKFSGLVEISADVPSEIPNLKRKS